MKNKTKLFAMPYYATFEGGSTSYMFVPFTENEDEFSKYIDEQTKAGKFFVPDKYPYNKKEIDIPGLVLYLAKTEYGNYHYYLLHESSKIPVKHGKVKNLKRLLNQITEFLSPLKWDGELHTITVSRSHYDAQRKVYGF